MCRCHLLYEYFGALFWCKYLSPIGKTCNTELKPDGTCATILKFKMADLIIFMYNTSFMTLTNKVKGDKMSHPSVPEVNCGLKV